MTDAHDGTSTSNHATEAAPPVSAASFRRRFRGYDRAQVDAWAVDIAGQVVDLREQLMERHSDNDELMVENRHLRSELRYWADRRTFIDGETLRVRGEATAIEREARARAESMEQQARQKALAMIDRVCTEASELMANARQEARELFARHDADLEAARRKVDTLTALQLEITAGLRSAMGRFEQGLQEVESVAPSMRATVVHESATRIGRERLVPTFGRTKALEAVGAGGVDQLQEEGAADEGASPVPTAATPEVRTIFTRDDTARLAASALNVPS